MESLKFCNTPRNTVKVHDNIFLRLDQFGVETHETTCQKSVGHVKRVAKNHTNGFSRYLYVHLYPLSEDTARCRGPPSSSRSQLPATTRSFLAVPLVEVSEGPKVV